MCQDNKAQKLRMVKRTTSFRLKVIDVIVVNAHIVDGIMNGGDAIGFD